MVAKQDMNDPILVQLKEMESVDVGRTGVVREWEFSKLTLEKTGLWVLIVDFLDNTKSLEMDYKISIVLDPSNYNKNLRGNMSEFNNPQRELFENEDKFLENARKIHRDYGKESEMFGTYDFEASVLKFERKAKSRQVKLVVNDSVAEYFRKNFGDLHRSALVLEKLTII